MNAHPTSSASPSQAGIMLIEALIAVLIFSLGILTIVALHATSIKVTRDAKYRTDATLLANRLIGEMWVSGQTIAALKTNFEPGGAAYEAWFGTVRSLDGLPGVVETPSSGALPTKPVVAVNSADGIVAITLFWRTPDMPISERHQQVVVSQIVRNP